jgi:capsular exopolysaccharide synthesis family protein
VDKLRRRIRSRPVDPMLDMREGISMAIMSLRAKPVIGTRIIAVSCDSTVPEIAAAYVNNIAQEFMAQNVNERTSNAQKTAQWLDSQVQETHIKLDEAQHNLEEFERRSGVVFQGPGEQGTLNDQKLTSLSGALAGIQKERIDKEAKYAVVKKGDPNAIPDVIDNPKIQLEREKLQELEAKKADLLKIYTEANSHVIDISRQMDDVRNSIQTDTKAIVQRIKDDYESALREEDSLRREYNSMAAKVTGQSDLASQHSLLKREVELYKAALNNMQIQVNQAAIVAALPANSVRIVDTAYPHYVPYKPNMNYFLTFGGIGGFAVAFGLVLLKDGLSKRKASTTFSAPGFASTVLSVPELGVIPSADYEADKSKKNGRRRILEGTIPKDFAVRGSFGMGLSAVSLYGKATLLAESFRLTVTSLMLMSRRDKRLKVIVVTSPGPGEGKTTVSSNIAVGLAEAGMKVLIVDMDLRRPRLHTIFDLPNEHGLCDLIQNKTPLLANETEIAIVATKIPGVSVLTSGKADVRAITEIFHSPRMPSLLKQLQETYDTVIVDTPPVLQFSESRLVASLADGVILVLRSGVTDKARAIMARDQLAMDGIEVIGAILNDWDPDSAGGDSKYQSYYSAYMQYHHQDGA